MYPQLRQGTATLVMDKNGSTELATQILTAADHGMSLTHSPILLIIYILPGPLKPEFTPPQPASILKIPDTA